MCVAFSGRDYNLPTRVGIPTLYLVATPSFLVLRVSLFAWLLRARDHYAVPDVLSGGDYIGTFPKLFPFSRVAFRWDFISGRDRISVRLTLGLR